MEVNSCESTSPRLWPQLTVDSAKSQYASALSLLRSTTHKLDNYQAVCVLLGCYACFLAFSWPCHSGYNEKRPRGSMRRSGQRQDHGFYLCSDPDLDGGNTRVYFAKLLECRTAHILWSPSCFPSDLRSVAVGKYKLQFSWWYTRVIYNQKPDQLYKNVSVTKLYCFSFDLAQSIPMDNYHHVPDCSCAGRGVVAAGHLRCISSMDVTCTDSTSVVPSFRLGISEFPSYYRSFSE